MSNQNLFTLVRCKSWLKLEVFQKYTFEDFPNFKERFVKI